MSIGHWGASAVGGFPDLRRLASWDIGHWQTLLCPTFKACYTQCARVAFLMQADALTM
ncbi:hypothetical protein [Nostoc sp.]|uniref:hypothetical protein n=1 Tax=Nostoc sp. TaxID=1180 RepID=UPI002FF979F6